MEEADACSRLSRASFPVETAPCCAYVFAEAGDIVQLHETVGDERTGRTIRAIVVADRIDPNERCPVR